MPYCEEVSLTELGGKLTDDYDVFLCSTSFELRSLAIAFSLKQLKVTRVIICHYENNYASANSHLQILRRLRPNHIVLDFKKDMPIENLDKVVKQIHNARRSGKVFKILVDISTFTHEMLMIFTYLFVKYFAYPDYSVKFLYNPATDYSIGDDFETKWLSKGVGQIRSVLGFSGSLLPLKKTLLIIFVGFEDERVKSIIELYEPSKVLLGHASKEGAINEYLQLKNKNIHSQIEKTLTVDVDTFEFSCKTPDETASNLNNVIYQYQDEFNIIIAALNNKISTIGCALAGIVNPHVQICYPTAIRYNVDKYSQPSDRAYIISF